MNKKELLPTQIQKYLKSKVELASIKHKLKQNK